MSAQHPTWVDVAAQDLDYWDDPRWLALTADEQSVGVDRYAAWLEYAAGFERPTEELADRVRLEGAATSDRLWAIVNETTA